MGHLKARIKAVLLWSQRYTRTDMLYLAHGGFWTALNLVVSALASVGLAVAFANLMPKEAYGTYRYVLSIAGAFGFLALTGMNASVTRSVARGHEGVLRHAVRAQLRWNLLYTAVVGIGGVYYLVRHEAVTLGVSLLALAVFLPPSWAFATYSAFIAGKRDFRRGTQYSLLGTAIYSLVMLAAVRYGGTALWLVVAYAVGTCGMYALLYALTLARYRPPAADAGEREEMERYGKHLSLLNALSVAVQQLDTIALFRLVGPAELAVYAFANLMPDRIRQFAKSGMGVLVPKLASKDLRDVVKSLRLRVLQSLAVGAAAAGAYIVAVPTVFRWLFPQYGSSVSYSQVIALNLIIALPLTYIAFVLQSQKLIREIYVVNVSTNVVRVALILGGGWAAGILGVILGKIGGNLFGAVVSYVLLERSMRRGAVASPAPID